VWQLSVAVRDAVYVLTGSGPASCDFAFRQQVRDAASSAPWNIAESFQRYNPPQFAQFMNIAKGALAETQNHLLHGKHQRYFSEQEFTDAWRLTCRALRAANRLHAYLRSCAKRSEPGRTRRT